MKVFNEIHEHLLHILLPAPSGGCVFDNTSSWTIFSDWTSPKTKRRFAQTFLPKRNNWWNFLNGYFDIEIAVLGATLPTAAWKKFQKCLLSFSAILCPVLQLAVHICCKTGTVLCRKVIRQFDPGQRYGLSSRLPCCSTDSYFFFIFCYLYFLPWQIWKKILNLKTHIRVLAA